jgi:hypothetical protein
LEHYGVFKRDKNASNVFRTFRAPSFSLYNGNGKKVDISVFTAIFALLLLSKALMFHVEHFAKY